MNYICKYFSPIGTLILESDGENLTGLWINNQKYSPNSLKGYQENADLEVFKNTKKWLDCYFKGEKPDFDISIKLEGTPFRKAVWKILCEIPHGKVITYGDIAKKIANQNGIKKMSARAIGGAVGHNPISIIVPCHRVIGSSGSLTGYGGGIDAKIKLLELENIKVKNSYISNYNLNKHEI